MRYCHDCKYFESSHATCCFHKKYIMATSLYRGYYLPIHKPASKERESSSSCGLDGNYWSPTFIGFFRHLLSRNY